MNDVVLTYNPYQHKSQILVDGQAFSTYSTISNYLLEPFECWCEKIGKSISDELNDEFSLTFVSDEMEAHIFESLIKTQCYDCKKITLKSFENDTPVALRMDMLFQALATKGLSFEKERRITAFFDDQVLMNNFLSSVENINGFSLSMLDHNTINCTLYSDACSIRINVSNNQKDTSSDGIFIFSNTEKAHEFLETSNFDSGKKVIIVLSHEFKTISVQKEYILLEMSAEYLVEHLSDLIEIISVKPMISQLATLLKDSDGGKYEAITTVDSIILVDFESSLEVNNSIPIIVRTIPENSTVPMLYVKTSNEKVVQVFTDRIVGIDKGEAVVEVYLAGNIAPIVRKTVTVIKRSKINKISFDSNAFDLEIGSYIVLNATLYPENADNLYMLKWTSSNPRVADVSSDGCITAMNAGECVISLSAEGVSAEVKINVYPKVEYLEVPGKYGCHIKSTLGQKIPYEVLAKPIDAYDKTVNWRVIQNNDCIFYDGHTITTNRIGIASIEFSSVDGEKKICTNIQVISTLYQKSNPFRFISLIALVITLIFSVFQSSIAIFVGLLAAFMGVISAFVDNKNRQEAQSIIGNVKKISLVPSVVLLIVAIATLSFLVANIV